MPPPSHFRFFFWGGLLVVVVEGEWVGGWAVCDGVKAGGHSQIKGDTAAA